MSPVSGLAVSTTRPTLLVNNAGVQGRAGRVDTGSRSPSTRRFENIVQQAVERSSGAQTSLRCPNCRRARSSSGASRASTARLPALVADPELPHARCRRPSACSVARAFAGPAAAWVAGTGSCPRGPASGYPPMSAVVNQVAAKFGALSNSCQDGGGAWEFMDRVINALRQHDTRWGTMVAGNLHSSPRRGSDWGRGPDQGGAEFTYSRSSSATVEPTRRQPGLTSPTRRVRRRPDGTWEI